VVLSLLNRSVNLQQGAIEIELADSSDNESDNQEYNFGKK